MKVQKIIITIALLLLCCRVNAQIGEHRNTLSVGGNAGYILSSVSFVPTVKQGYHGGLTGGFSVRYTCEKYFSTICSIYGEVNYASIGWKQKIETADEEPVINSNGNVEEFSRTINYIQVPLMAHLAWGRETNGLNFFFRIGPQVGFYLSDSVHKNYDEPNIYSMDGRRGNVIVNQETMPVENKIEYGIAGGLGMEFSRPNLGHFLVEARYYFGLGNIYGNSKRDYFAKSNYNNIVLKVSYLFDITKTKK